ncbi:choline ethanolaminephosphotransferase [Flagelloscypha sp. PMI_526]|nr:choline ethanolaminephosphotransferase [Flagelloscypha sp. PMI_526]
MGYIPQRNLENLKKYKYSGVDKYAFICFHSTLLFTSTVRRSILSKYVLNPFWTWFVTLWPATVAPNTITMSGLGLVLVNFATMIYYNPLYLTEKEGAEIPSWVYLTWAAGLFWYQAFDAIDGKQARRTGMAGPLGEMFDHGCDALNTTLECVLANQALNLGRSWWTVSALFAALANFYLTTWEEYHTGSLYLGVFSGPVEGILMIVGVYIISAIYGPGIWETPILSLLRLDHIEALRDVPNVPINIACMIFGVCGLLFNIAGSYHNVYTSARSKGTSVLKPILLLAPLPIASGIQIAWLAHPSVNNSAILYSSNFLPFMCAWGLQFAHQVGRMILAHTTRMDFPMWDAIWIWSLVGAVDANLPRLFGIDPIIQTSELNTTILVWSTLAISLVSYLRFCTLVIQDITGYMGIACFTTKKRGADGVWRTTEQVKKEL